LTINHFQMDNDKKREVGYVNYKVFFLQLDMCSLEKNLPKTTKLTSWIQRTLS